MAPDRLVVPKSDGLLRRVGAVDQMIGPGDEAGPIRQQEAGQGRNLFGRAEPARSVQGLEVAPRFRVKVLVEQPAWR